MSQSSLNDYTSPEEKPSVNILMAEPKEAVIVATPPPDSAPADPTGSPYKQPKQKCPEPGCGKYLWKDGFCHNYKCRRERRLMSIVKIQGTPQQKTDGAQAFRRFLAD